ncbi:MAG: FecR domain-containing protein [Pseudomonadota bacterium]
MVQPAVAATPRHFPLPRVTAFITALFLACSLPASGDIARGSDTAELALAPAPSESDADWTYTVKPDDTPRAIAERLLSDRHGTTQLMSYNGMARDASLEPGETLQVPIQWLNRRPRPAEATSVRGNAWRTRHPESSRTQLEKGDRLNVGDGVRTGNDGHARIELADGSTLAVEPDTQLMFNRLTQYGRGAMADTRMNLERGRVETRVEPNEKDGSRFEIHTPSAVAAVRGTRFGLESRSDGTLLEVLKGEVWFGTPQSAEPVREGHSAFQAPGAEPVIRPLPPAPRITTGPEAAGQLPMSVDWQAPDGIERFRVDLYRSDNGDWEKSETISDNGYELADLDNGQYQLRVASLSDDRRGGADTLAFEIGLQARPASLRAPERDATLEDNQPLFEWSLQGDSEKARVQLARTPEFDETIANSPWKRSESARLSEPLEPGRYCWRVVTRTGGDATATSPVSCFQLAGKLKETRIISANVIDDRVNLYWRSLDNAERYRLQLAEDGDFENIIQDREVDDTEIRMRLDPGQRYHVRVKGLAPEPMSSDWGEVREITIE